MGGKATMCRPEGERKPLTMNLSLPINLLNSADTVLWTVSSAKKGIDRNHWTFFFVQIRCSDSADIKLY